MKEKLAGFITIYDPANPPSVDDIKQMGRFN